MKKTTRLIRVVEWMACLGMGLIFLLSAWGKLQDPLSFALALDQFQILPDFLINPTAVFLPWIELVLALALWFVPSLRKDALLLCGLLMLTFTAALLVSLVQGKEVICGCFGTYIGPVTWWEIIRNIAFLTLIALGLTGRYLDKSRFRQR